MIDIILTVFVFFVVSWLSYRTGIKKGRTETMALVNSRAIAMLAKAAAAKKIRDPMAAQKGILRS